MSKSPNIEDERMDVAEWHLERLVRSYKEKPRKGKQLEKLKSLEAALQHLHHARLL